MWEWLRRLFDRRKGRTRIGQGKEAVRGSTPGDKSVITSSGNVHVTLHSGDLGRQQELDISSLDELAKQLLLSAAASEHGVIQRVGHGAGVMILANGTPVPTDGSPRSAARLEGALQELERCRLVEARGSKTEIFFVTVDGYRVAAIVRG